MSHDEAQRLAALIREVDGNHDLGAAALADALLARGVTVAASHSSIPREPSEAAIDAAEEVLTAFEIHRDDPIPRQRAVIMRALRAAYAVDAAPRE